MCLAGVIDLSIILPAVNERDNWRILLRRLTGVITPEGLTFEHRRDDCEGLFEEGWRVSSPAGGLTRRDFVREEKPALLSEIIIRSRSAD
jgi:hypothetical protein